MSNTNYFAKELVKHIAGENQYTRTSIFIGVGTTSPADTDENSWSGEVSGNGYRRQRVLFDPPAVVDSYSTRMANKYEIRFPQATGNWGTLGYYALWTAPTGGKLLCYGAMIVGGGSTISINTGNTLRIAKGGLLVTYSGMFSSFYLQDSLLNHVFCKDTGGASFSLPSIHLALVNSFPDPNVGGSGLDEPSGNYARESWNDWTAPAAAMGIASVKNDDVVVFNQASANWGELRYCVLTDAASSGEWLTCGSIVPPTTINSGNEPRYAIDDLLVST